MLNRTAPTGKYLVHGKTGYTPEGVAVANRVVREIAPALLESVAPDMAEKLRYWPEICTAEDYNEVRFKCLLSLRSNMVKRGIADNPAFELLYLADVMHLKAEEFFAEYRKWLTILGMSE